MGTERERKFLIADDTWLASVTSTTRIKQGYLSRGPACTVRVRVAGDRGFITVKSAFAEESRREYEYEIPCGHADEVLTSLVQPPITCKVRHEVPFAGSVWTVDVFEGVDAGLVLAEVELETSPASLILPSWVGREVTGDPRFYGATRPPRDEGTATVREDNR